VRANQVIKFLFFSNSPGSQIGRFSYIQHWFSPFGFHNLIIKKFIIKISFNDKIIDNLITSFKGKEQHHVRRVTATGKE
jgi:hypothetical protein